jgi:hypothetical protein
MEERYDSKDRAGYYRESSLAHGSPRFPLMLHSRDVVADFVVSSL